MTKLEKVLTDRGILFEPDEHMIMMGPEHDCCRRLVTITDQFIIAVLYSAVLPEQLYLYDRHTFELVGVQNLYPEDNFFDNNRWECYAYYG